jgi:hypothetical protein
MTAIFHPGPAARGSAPPSADAVALERDLRQRVGGVTRSDAGRRGAHSAGTLDYRHLIALPGPTAGFAVSQLSARTGLRLSGRADLDTVDLLKHAIAALPADAGEIHLQLASLEFIDEAAARELVMLTGRPNQPRMVLHYPPPVMLSLLRLHWPEARPRFTISAGRPDST